MGHSSNRSLFLVLTNQLVSESGSLNKAAQTSIDGVSMTEKMDFLRFGWTQDFLKLSWGRWNESRDTSIESNKYPWINGFNETIFRTKYFYWWVIKSPETSYTAIYLAMLSLRMLLTGLLFYFSSSIKVFSCAFSINDIKAGCQQHEMQVESNRVFLK